MSAISGAPYTLYWGAVALSRLRGAGGVDLRSARLARLGSPPEDEPTGPVDLCAH